MRGKMVSQLTLGGDGFAAMSVRKRGFKMMTSDGNDTTTGCVRCHRPVGSVTGAETYRILCQRCQDAVARAKER